MTEATEGLPQAELASQVEATEGPFQIDLVGPLIGRLITKFEAKLEEESHFKKRWGLEQTIATLQAFGEASEHCLTARQVRDVWLGVHPSQMYDVAVVDKRVRVMFARGVFSEEGLALKRRKKGKKSLDKIEYRLVLDPQKLARRPK